MRRTWWFVLTPAVGLALAAGAWRTRVLAQASASPPPLPIGVVDMVRLFNECDQWKAVNDALTAERRKSDAEADKRKEEIAAKAKELEAYHPDTPDWTRCSEELLRLQTSAEVWARLEKSRVERIKKDRVEKNYAAITKAIADIARQHGLVMVLTREELETNTEDSNRLFAQIINRKVVYYDPRLDITEAVLKKVNDDFKLAGGPEKLNLK